MTSVFKTFSPFAQNRFEVMEKSTSHICARRFFEKWSCGRDTRLPCLALVTSPKTSTLFMDWHLPLPPNPQAKERYAARPLGPITFGSIDPRRW